MDRRIKNSYYEPLTSKQDIGKNLFYKINTDARVIMITIALACILALTFYLLPKFLRA
jgi:hypothetical protein